MEALAALEEEERRFDSINQKQVYLRLAFIKLGDINTSKNTFMADVELFARWREPYLDMGATQEELRENYWNPKLSIVNCVGQPKIKTDTVAIYHQLDGLCICEKKIFRSLFYKTMKLCDFPFDVQELHLIIMSDTAVEDTYLTDEPFVMHEIRKQPFVHEREFYWYKLVEVKYSTVFTEEENSTPKQRRSGAHIITRPSVKVFCYAARRCHFYIWNIFISRFLIGCMMLVSFLADTISLEMSRLQICFVLFICLCALQGTIVRQVPPVPLCTYNGRYFRTLVCYLVILTFYQSAITRIVNPVIRTTVDFYASFAFVAVHVLYNVIFIILILKYPMTVRRKMAAKERNYMALLEETKLLTKIEK